MKHWKHIGPATAVAALLCGTSASAELTAEQVWQSWVDYSASFGQKITEGSRTMEGDTLVIKDAAMEMAMPEGSSSIAMPEMRFKELGDGRVEVSFPATMPVKIAGKSQTGGAADIQVSVNQTNAKMIVAGTPEDMTYDFAADTMAVKLDSITEDGNALPINADFALNGATGTYHMTNAGGRTLDSTFKADTMTFNVAGSDPTTPDTSFNAAGSFNGVSGKSSATIPEGIDMAKMNEALAAGLNISSEMTFGGGGYTFDIKDPTQAMTGKVDGSGGAFNVVMSKDAFGYGVTGSGAKVSATVSTLPFPIDVSYSEAAVNFMLPTTKGDAAQPFSMLVKLADLSLSDGIWGMIDPGAQLPHDPATMVIDVNGTAKLTADIFDPARAQSSDMPGELESFSLNQLLLKAVGAELSGTGSATVDNSAGMPKPIGSIDLKLVGGNALIDKLVAMGLIPQDQAMGAKMMMGMFAVASGEDELTSKIEFKEDGGIYANGQRIQ